MYKVGVVGATGIVGQSFLKLIEERNFPLKELRPFASENSVGRKLKCNSQDWTVSALYEGCFDGLDVVFFSSGDDISKVWAPKAEAAGAFAIDNSAAFRMSKDHKLVVPEVNGHLLDKTKKEIIANPNCSTIQLAVALNPLKKFGLKDVRVASYQSVSGAGIAAKQELINQLKQAIANEKVDTSSGIFTKQIAFNSIPQIGSFKDDGFCTEEIKIMSETPKILGTDINMSAFTVRVPTLNGHAEAVWVTLDKDITKDEFINTLKSQEGLEVIEGDDYPTVLFNDGKNEVYVGRIHKDRQPNTWLFWVTADNILKGAALNGIQIAEKLFC